MAGTRVYKIFINRLTSIKIRSEKETEKDRHAKFTDSLPQNDLELILRTDHTNFALFSAHNDAKALAAARRASYAPKAARAMTR